MTIVELAAATDPRCGGKARGLARLLALGLPVPPGFVLVGEPDRGALLDAYATLGAGKVAVRSSAIAEDGDEASYAGVFESVLEVEGEAALVAAVERCLASAHAARVSAYEGASAGAEASMAVVVQRMVDADRAGVLFTCDPVDGERRFVIEAVAGLGEALVAGHARPDRYVVDADGTTLERSASGPTPLLDEATIRALISAASDARDRLESELDMEWAIDRGGDLHWLQARPITRVGQLALDELDSRIGHATPGFIRYNVGEILPGAVTPLTITTCVEMIDRGFQRAYEHFGVFDPPGGVDPTDTCVAVFSGHLFMNIRGPYLFAAKTGGGSKVEADRSLGGRVFDELEGFPVRGRASRAWMATRVFARLRRSDHEVAGVAGGIQRFIDAAHERRTLADLLAHLDELVAYGAHVSEVHMIASTWSGMLYGILQGVLTGGAPPTPSQREQLAGLLCGVGRVESADIGAAMAELAAALRADPAARRACEEAGDDDELLAWLRRPESAPCEAFASFLERHGHRCVRELELRERDWAEDPRPLVAVLRASIHAPERERATALDPDALGCSPRTARALRWLLPKVHEAVRLRERCKSLLVRCARLIKATSVAIGERLIADGRLPELDRIYFLTRAELVRLAAPELAASEAQALARLAVRRRHAHARQQGLRFAMVCPGRPQPLPPIQPPAGVRRLRGTSVSRGVVEGFARVVTSPAEAVSMRPGEILIVPFTDAGWSPYFNLAAGLATEIGGTLSHGAVVAREVGLPAVVDLCGATELVRTGQRVRLDADAGVLELLD